MKCWLLNNNIVNVGFILSFEIQKGFDFSFVILFNKKIFLTLCKDITCVGKKLSQEIRIGHFFNEI